VKLRSIRLNAVAGFCLLSLFVVYVFFVAAAHSETGGTMAPFFNSEFIFEKIDGYPSCHAATLTELPDGDLMAAWYSGEYERAKDVAIFSSVRSKQTGKWSAPVILQDTPGLSEGNPVLFTDRRGRVWFFFVTMYGEKWTDCRMYYKISDDGGKTWSNPVTLIGEKGWMTRNKPIELKNGAFILPIYNEVKWSPLFMFSADGGNKWVMKGEDLRVPGGAIQPSIIQRTDGSLLAFLRTGEQGGNIWTITSEDSGLNWGNPIRTSLLNPNSAIDAVKLKSGAVVLAYNDSPFDRVPLVVALSMDDGETWQFEKKIEKKYGEFSYPAVIQSSDGIIHIVYTYKRTQIKHIEFNEEWLKQKTEKSSGNETQK
jgi:predicted neuraminidase